MIVMGGIFFVAAVILLILSFTLDFNSDEYIGFWVFSGMCAFLGLFFLFYGIYQLSLSKKREAKLADTSSLAYKTYGKGGNYTYFVAYLNSTDTDADRTGKTVAMNVVSALSFVTLGVGVFGSAGGRPNVDVFVSPEEIILKPISNDLSDSAFRRIPAVGIINIMYASDTKHEKVYVVLKGGRFTLDIPVNSVSDVTFIRNVFDMFKKAPDAVSAGTEQSAPFQEAGAPQSAVREGEVQKTSASSDDVFDI